MKYHLGTSGWSYPDWRGRFYPEEVTQKDWLPFHGLTGGFRHNYTEEELAKWAAVIKETQAQEFFIYFNNDYRAQAVFNCKTLGKLLSD